MVDVDFDLIEAKSRKERFYDKEKVSYYWILRDDLTKEEIENIREIDDVYFENEGDRLIANFLPDGERPADIPKY